MVRDKNSGAVEYVCVCVRAWKNSATIANRNDTKQNLIVMM